MRRVRSLPLVLALAAACAACPVRAAELRLAPADTTVQVGATFTLRVTCDGVSNVKGMQTAHAFAAGLDALGWRPDRLLVCVAPAPAQFAESDWRRAASEVVAAYDVPGVSLHVTARPDWRKPQPGMLHAAAAHFDVGPAALTYVGDMDGDRLAAETAGARFVHAAAWREGAEL